MLFLLNLYIALAPGDGARGTKYDVGALVLSV